MTRFTVLAQPMDLPAGLDVIGDTVLGVVVILFIVGYVWAKPAVDGLKEENTRLNGIIERKDSELASLRQSIDEKVVPTIEKNTRITERVVDLLNDEVNTERRLVEVLARLEGHQG